MSATDKLFNDERRVYLMGACVRRESHAQFCEGPEVQFLRPTHRGRFRLLGLVAALCGIIRREVAGRGFAIIDDTLAPRSSVRAPGAAVGFDHAAKTNRPTFLLCPSFVTLSAVVPCQYH
jgi:hypothetical protein